MPEPHATNQTGNAAPDEERAARRRSPSMARIMAALLMSLGIGSGAATAQSAPCGLCARQVVISPPLADCLLREYDVLATAGDDGAIAIDLTGCEQERGIVEALPSAAESPPEPDLRFLVSRRQLDCLKDKIEQPGSVADPVTTIDLSACE